MALNWIDVNAVGELVAEKDRLVLKVKGSDQSFLLKEGDKKVFARLREAAEGKHKTVNVGGRVEAWTGHFPPFLKTLPKKPRAITVKEFELVK